MLRQCFLLPLSFYVSVWDQDCSLPFDKGRRDTIHVPFLTAAGFGLCCNGGAWEQGVCTVGKKKNRLLICDYLRLSLFNHGFISCSVSLLLYFSFWQVDQEAVAKSFIVCGILATLGSMAMRESSLATLVTFYPGCSSLKSHSCWLPCTPPSGFILRMSQ